MRKVDGHIETQQIEVGAKWYSDDGKEFNSESDCKKYEEKLAIEKEKETAKKVLRDFESKELYDGTKVCLYTDEVAYTLLEFKTKEDFIKVCKAISTDDRYKYLYVNEDYMDYLKAIENLNFPAKFLFAEIESDGDYYRTDYMFYDVDFYKKRLLVDIVSIDKASELLDKNNKDCNI